MIAGPSLPELWSYVVMHHGALKGFAQRNAASWSKDVRRTAWTGLAVLASLLRRLIHLMARDIPLGPPYPAEAGTPLPPLPAQRRPRLAFRLTERPRERAPRARDPAHVPETPDFNHARFLERLSVLAAAYRARARLARRLARRAQTGRAPLRALPLPPRLYARTPRGFTGTLDHVDRLLSAPPDTS